MLGTETVNDVIKPYWWLSVELGGDPGPPKSK
jgi:hypothetical protein